MKFEESLGMGFVAIGKLDTGFNPASGEIGDVMRESTRPGTTASRTPQGSLFRLTAAAAAKLLTVRLMPV